MQTAGFVDQLLDIHRDGNAFLSVRQATIASLKTGLAMAFPHLMGTSDAPVPAEVERILSNIVAHIAPFRSRTCWHKDSRQSRENAPPSSALDLHPWTPPPGQAPRKRSDSARLPSFSRRFPAGYKPHTQFMLVS